MPLPLQIQFRTGKGRLREKIVQLFAGPWRGHHGLRPVGFFAQGGQGVIEHLIRASKVAALDFLLDDPFLFRLELDGHCLRPFELSVNSMISRSPFLPLLHKRFGDVEVVGVHDIVATLHRVGLVALHADDLRHSGAAHVANSGATKIVKSKVWNSGSFASFALRPTQVLDGLAVAGEDIPGFRPVLITLFPRSGKESRMSPSRIGTSLRLSVVCRLKADERRLLAHTTLPFREEPSQSYKNKGPISDDRPS